MTTQRDYTAEEWNTLLQAPGFAITFIIQSGICSQPVAHRKMLAGIEAIVQTSVAEPSCTLIHSVQEAIMAGQRPHYSFSMPTNLDEARDMMLAGCRQVVRLLSQRAPEDEANAYLRWIFEIARIVAAVPNDALLADEMSTRQNLAALEVLAHELDVREFSFC